MRWRSGLSRQIMLSMAALAVTTVLIVFFGAYGVYWVIQRYLPAAADPDGMSLTWTDFLIVGGLMLVTLSIASATAFKLAERILTPLTSLAESARRIAQGDLTARAVPGDKSLGETAHLVEDFNAMAQKLEDMAGERTAWNAAIAHELRTPLTILRGRLQGIADGVFQADATLINNLLLQTEGLTRLVEDLRTVTMADSSRLELQLEPTSLSSNIQHVAELLAPSLQASGFALDMTLIDLDVIGDGVRIRQALLALLDNAQRYAAPGRIEIMTLKSGDSAIVRVEDEGPGLPPDFAAHAFDPFARGERSRSRQHGGSGLGLTVVRAIAEAHGGSASYRASSRGGAIFEIALPLAA